MTHLVLQSLLGQLQPVTKEWGENKRLRIGVLAILILLLGYVISLAADWRASNEATYYQTAQQLARMQSLVGQTVWQERALAAQAAIEKRERRLWTAKSTSLARADVQAWLKELMAESGITKSRMDVLPLSTSQFQGVVELHASVNGSYTPATVAALLYQLESSSRMVVVSYLDLVNRRQKSFRLELVVYFKPPDDWIGVRER